MLYRTYDLLKRINSHFFFGMILFLSECGFQLGLFADVVYRKDFPANGGERPFRHMKKREINEERPKNIHSHQGREVNYPWWSILSFLTVTVFAKLTNCEVSNFGLLGRWRIWALEASIFDAFGECCCCFCCCCCYCCCRWMSKTPQMMRKKMVWKPSFKLKYFMLLS